MDPGHVGDGEGAAAWTCGASSWPAVHPAPSSPSTHTHPCTLLWLIPSLLAPSIRVASETQPRGASMMAASGKNGSGLVNGGRQASRNRLRGGLGALLSAALLLVSGTSQAQMVRGTGEPVDAAMRAKIV